MRIGYEAKRVFHNRSGLGNYSRNLIRALAQYHPENSYFLYNPSLGKIKFGDDFDHVHEIRPDYKNPILTNLWRQKLVTQRAKKDKVDVFHGLSHELPSNLDKKGIPSIVSVHDLIFIRKPELYSPIDRKIYTLKVKSACQQASKIVATSEQTKNDLQEYLDIDKSKIEVIYQGCDPLFWQSHNEDDLKSVKEKYRLPAEYLLFVGTLEERKNVTKIVEEAKSIGMPLVLIGKKTPYWKNYAAKSIRKKDAIFTPTVTSNTDLAKIYQGASLFIYPSHFEGFGIPVLEALASKVPVITSNKSSLPEVAGPDSILVDPDNPSDMNNAIQMIMSSSKLQTKMKENGYTFAQKFKDEQIANQWHSLYSNLNES
jgi:glycosyltransferase involved in cell wall biosynthesis